MKVRAIVTWYDLWVGYVLVHQKRKEESQKGSDDEPRD